MYFIVKNIMRLFLKYEILLEAGFLEKILILVIRVFNSILLWYIIFAAKYHLVLNLLASQMLSSRKSQDKRIQPMLFPEIYLRCFAEQFTIV